MSKYDFELNIEDRNSLSVLISRIKPNSTILEFGPANGRMTKYLKEELNCKVYAVELDEKAAKDAGKYTEDIVVDSIENYRWQKRYKNIKFDFIIFADVLEHLYTPKKVLEEVRDFLKEDGSILVSIPNIAHNAIIIDLLQNEFNYHPTGLLDNTHIRFFTKKTFDELVEKVGYFRCYESAIYSRPENTEFANSYESLPSEIAKYMEQSEYGEIYQLIYELKKEPCKTEHDYADKKYNILHNFIQLFVDEGEGYSEEHSIKYYVNTKENTQKFVFDLQRKKNIKSLRLDPLDDFTILEIVSIQMNNQPYEGEIGSNTFYQDKNIYYFDTIDPQFYLELEGLDHIDILSCEFRYLYTGRDALIEINRMSQNLVKKKEEQLQQKDQQLQQKEQQIQQLLELAESMRIKNRIKRLLKIGKS